MATSVMVVEDDYLVANDLKAQLRQLGHTVTAIVSTGEEALKMALHDRPDAILMDIGLDGDMDGIQAAQAIRETMRVPIIFLSGHAAPELVHRAQSAQPAAYLVKPFSSPELNATIETVTYKARLDERLRRSEERLRTVLEATNQAYWEYHPLDGNWRMGEMWNSFLGREHADPPASLERWLDQIHPLDRQEVLPSLYELQAGKRHQVELEYRVPHAKGGWRLILTRGRVVEWNQEGLPRRIVGTHSDVTIRRDLEEAWRKYAFIANAAKDPMSLVNQEYRYELVNLAFLDALGLSVNKLRQRKMADIWGERTYRRCIQPYLQRCLGGEEVQQQTWINFYRRGRGYYQVSYLPYRDHRGRITHAVIISHEITAHKLAQQNLEEARDYLEARVRERTGELEELNTALKVLLEHRDQERHRLEGNVLASVKTLVVPFLDKLQQTRLSDSQKSIVRIALANLEEITSSFASHLSSLSVALTPKELEVAALVRDGKSTQEIADIQCISENSVTFHRRNIRAKLGLAGRKINLSSYLRQLR